MKKLAINLALLSILTFFSINLSAQSIIWEKIYGGGADDIGYSIVETSDGGLLACGTTESFGEGQTDIYLIKMNNDGDSIWTKTIGGFDIDEGFDVELCEDDGFAIVGSTRSYGEGLRDLFLVKTDSDGDIEWTKTYGGLLDDGSYDVQQCSDDGFILLGYTNTIGSGENDAVLIKTDSDGIEEWTQTYGGIYDEFGYSASECSDEGFILAGSTKSYGAGGTDIYIIKTDDEGEVDWSKSYGTTQNESATHIEQDTDGSYYFTGNADKIGATGQDIFLFRIDSIGDSLFVNRYGLAGTNTAKHTKRIYDGGYIISSTMGDPTEGIQTRLIRTNHWGDSLWSTVVGGDHIRDAEFGLVDGDSTLTIIGSRQETSSSDLDIVVFAYELECGVWYPRTIQITNLYCNYQDTFQVGNLWPECFPDVKELIVFGAGDHAMQLEQEDFLQYCYDMKIHSIEITGLHHMMLENFTESAAKRRILQDDLRDFMFRARDRYRIDEIIAWVKSFEDENNANMFRCERLIDSIAAYNQDPSTTAKMQFTGISLAHEWYNKRYGCNTQAWKDYHPGYSCNNLPPGTPTYYPKAKAGWANYLALLDHGSTVVDNTPSLTRFRADVGRLDRDVIGDSTVLDDDYIAQQISDRTGDIIMYFYMEEGYHGGQDSTPVDLRRVHAYEFLSAPQWRQPWVRDRLRRFSLVTNPITISPGFSAQGSQQIILPQKILGNWMNGQGDYTLNNPGPGVEINETGQHYVPDAENTFIDQFLDMPNLVPSFTYGSISKNLGPMTWFKYGHHPVEFGHMRTQDQVPNYYIRPCNSARMSSRTDDFSSNEISQKQRESKNLVAGFQPNPFRERTSINIGNLDIDIPIVQLVNSLGEECTSDANVVIGGDKLITIKNVSLQPGVYFALITNEENGEIIRRKITFIR